MEPLVAKMKEYLAMETEISFAEFKEYYQQVMDYLQSNYQEMDNEALISAKFVLDIIKNNAQDRAARKVAESKKYKKMAEKCSFWSEAITYRLEKSGLTRQEMEEKIAQLSE